MVYLILPSVSWLCVSTYTFTNPLAIIVVLFLDIIYIPGLIFLFFNYIRSIRSIYKVTRYFKPSILDRLYTYKDECATFGDGVCNQVTTCKIDGVNRLKTIKIGNNSFTQKKNRYGNDESKSFHILNCKSLQSIEIGEYSFTNFAGKFELKNLPHLQSIQIGTIGNDSYNFYFSSFVIRGITIRVNISYHWIFQIYNPLH